MAISDAPPETVSLNPDLSARLTALEAKVDAGEASSLRRLGAMAGFVGLSISIITGLFTLFDRVVTKPLEVRTVAYNQLKSDIRLIISINQQMFETSSTATNDAVRMNVMQSGNSQVQSLLDDATRLLKEIDSTKSAGDAIFKLGSTDYNILAQAAFTGGDLPLALTYADRSVQAATNPHTKSESLRTKAVMIMAVGGDPAVGKARAALAEAIRITDARADTFNALMDKAAIHATSASIEASSGHCAEAQDQAGRLVALVADPNLPPAARQFATMQLVGGLTGQARCPLDGFPAAVRQAMRGASSAAPPGGVALAQGPAPPTMPPPSAVTPVGSSQAVKLVLTCRYKVGPRAGELQSFEGVPGVSPVPVGTSCGDGNGSFGLAE